MPPQTTLLAHSTKNTTFKTQNNIFGEPIPERNVVRKIPTLPGQLTNNNNGLHNPLTNPMPTNLQNPYIARELAKAQNSKNIFSNLADRNLINKT